MRRYSGSAVPRHHVFILSDGTFVVQWDENRVQELLSGRYRNFVWADFGHAITDYELKQLKAAGRVEHYNRNYVWLYALPETGRLNRQIKTLDRPRNSVRTYYLTTSLPKSQLENVRALLKTIGQGDELYARERDGVLVVFGKQGAAFRRLADVEQAQKLLREKDSALFGDAAIAFVEQSVRDSEFRTFPMDENLEITNFDLDALIASQSDTLTTDGKKVVLVVGNDDERKAIESLLLDMKLGVHVAATGADGLDCLEDIVPELLIMDLQLPDMHGWKMLGKAREVDSLRDIRVIVIGDHEAAPNEQTFALTVAKVDIYLLKPISMALLRQNVWMVLKEVGGNSNHNS